MRKGWLMEGALALAPVLGADVAATIGRVLRRGEAATALQTAWRRHHAQRRAWGLWVRAQQGRVEFGSLPPAWARFVARAMRGERVRAMDTDGLFLDVVSMYAHVS